MCREKYSNKRQLFIDGTKRDEGVGAAVVWDGGVRMTTLPGEASIFSAELYAIVIGELTDARKCNR